VVATKLGGGGWAMDWEGGGQRKSGKGDRGQ